MQYAPGEIISYLNMCQKEGASLQRGMNFRLRGGSSVILMSRRANAPYADHVEDDGRTLIYEGHDAPRDGSGVDPKTLDQPEKMPNGKLTQNGLFYAAARAAKLDSHKPEKVRVYEKLRDGIWVFNGVFLLKDAWLERSGTREVFKFRLEVSDGDTNETRGRAADLEHNRMIPASVKFAVWKRDKGKCVKCGCADNLHFDHIIPYSRGGSSLVAENIQLLCARHNLGKRDNIA
jgi:hypothetical protein